MFLRSTILVVYEVSGYTGTGKLLSGKKTKKKHKKHKKQQNKKRL